LSTSPAPLRTENHSSLHNVHQRVILAQLHRKTPCFCTTVLQHVYRRRHGGSIPGARGARRWKLRRCVRNASGSSPSGNANTQEYRYKAIDKRSGEVVAIKHVSVVGPGYCDSTDFVQIDLESSEDDILEIQQEISVLSTCASPYVTQYIASFLRGHKLWIVMEYLGGGSCLDLVGNSSAPWATVLT
jgi:hypothetical protein